MNFRKKKKSGIKEFKNFKKNRYKFWYISEDQTKNRWFTFWFIKKKRYKI
jgi:hypothetical protein